MVTIYERDDAIGGLLQYGIPAMKLSRAVVDRRVRLLEQKGITFRTGINVGKEVSAKDLYREYDSMVLCMGATWPREIPIPGRELEGIYQAVAFLETWQKKQSGKLGNPAFTAKDKDVTFFGHHHRGMKSA